MNRRELLAGASTVALVALGAGGAVAEPTDAPDGGSAERTGHCDHDCQQCLDQPTCFDCTKACFPWIA